uniref:Uncharacterized protein n=1 Tax=Astyanax mexicanus TaxID=7994 RepID=A0A3B1IUJ5_ASTMX
MAFTTKPCHQNFIATVVGHESGNLLAVLDQLDPDALPNSRVRLLGFNTTAESSSEGVSLQGGAQIGLLVLFIVPFLLTAVVPQLSGGTKQRKWLLTSGEHNTPTLHSTSTGPLWRLLRAPSSLVST